MKSSTQDTAALATGYKNTSLIQGADHKGVQGAQGPCRHQCVAGRAPPRERENEREGERERERERGSHECAAKRAASCRKSSPRACHANAEAPPAWLSPIMGYIGVIGLFWVLYWDNGKENGNYYIIIIGYILGLYRELWG